MPLSCVCVSQEEDDEEDECVRLREVTRRLYAQLQKAERRHQEERDKMQVRDTNPSLFFFHFSYCGSLSLFLSVCFFLFLLLFSLFCLVNASHLF